MTSETRTAYGSRVRRQGNWWRPWARYQRIKARRNRSGSDAADIEVLVVHLRHEAVGVLRGHQVEEEGPFEREAIRERCLRSSADKAFDVPDRPWRLRGEFLGESRRMRERSTGRSKLLDDSQFEGLFRRDGPSAQRHFQRAAHTDEACELLCAARAGEDADVDFRQPELVVAFFSDADVTSERQFEAATHGHTVNSGNDRLWHGLDALE